jgi:hypothetical protein
VLVHLCGALVVGGADAGGGREGHGGHGSSKGVGRTATSRPNGYYWRCPLELISDSSYMTTYCHHLTAIAEMLGKIT